MNKRINATIFLWSKEPDCSCNWIKWYVNVTDTSHSMTYHRHRHFLHPHAERVGRWNIFVLIAIQSRRKIYFLMFSISNCRASFCHSLFFLSFVSYMSFSLQISSTNYFSSREQLLFMNMLSLCTIVNRLFEEKIIFSTFFLIC